MSQRIDRLAVRAASGDAQAVEELLAENLSALRAFVRLRMGPTLRAKESASDLVQSVCREILAHQERFQFRDGDNFRRWLFTTALRVVQKKARYWQQHKRDADREARRPRGGSASGDGFSDCYRSMITPSRDALAREEYERFERAFETLSEEHREVISLSRIVGLSHQEIAAEMARSEAATRQLLHRALASLSMALQAGFRAPRTRPHGDPGEGDGPAAQE